eukprot:1138269-Pelagomonas_calceolata.AAC.1
MSPLHHKATRQKTLMGIWRVTGSTRLQNLAMRSNPKFSCQDLGCAQAQAQALHVAQARSKAQALQ